MVLKLSWILDMSILLRHIIPKGAAGVIKEMVLQLCTSDTGRFSTRMALNDLWQRTNYRRGQKQEKLPKRPKGRSEKRHLSKCRVTKKNEGPKELMQKQIKLFLFQHCFNKHLTNMQSRPVPSQEEVLLFPEQLVKRLSPPLHSVPGSISYRSASWRRPWLHFN